MVVYFFLKMIGLIGLLGSLVKVLKSMIVSVFWDITLRCHTLEDWHFHQNRVTN